MDKNWWIPDQESTDGLAGGCYEKDSIEGQSVRDAQPKTKNAKMCLMWHCSVKMHPPICQDFSFCMYNKLFRWQDRECCYFRTFAFAATWLRLFTFIEFDVAQWQHWHSSERKIGYLSEAFNQTLPNYSTYRVAGLWKHHQAVLLLSNCYALSFSPSIRETRELQLALCLFRDTACHPAAPFPCSLFFSLMVIVLDSQVRCMLPPEQHTMVILFECWCWRR